MQSRRRSNASGVDLTRNWAKTWYRRWALQGVSESGGRRSCERRGEFGQALMKAFVAARATGFRGLDDAEEAYFAIRVG